MRIAAIAFTDCGMALGRRLQEQAENMTLERCEKGGLAAWTARAFSDSDALVFIGAAGIAVRAVAPHVETKTCDPAVVVLDELGTFAIPILSGHLGGANALAAALARQVGAIPVITTATDVHGLFAVDDWARTQGLAVANPQRIKWISARLLAGETIRFKSLYPIDGALPAQLEPDEEGYDMLVSHRSRGRVEALRLVPRIVTAGIGCRRGAAAETIEAAFAAALGKAGCHPLAVGAVATIGLKAEEPGLLAFCRSRSLPLVTYTAEELSAMPGSFTGSAFVKKTTGVDNVCERAAVRHSGGRLLTRKEAGNGVTVALAIREAKLTWGERK
ncbi:MAG: cobalamin biosynthesis protein CbiG [Ruminococcaceae bacterium]|nr:cobalamin biosynthesis protein CbiG [Oscillospiraceae bacterium]